MVDTIKVGWQEATRVKELCVYFDIPFVKIIDHPLLLNKKKTLAVVVKTDVFGDALKEIGEYKTRAYRWLYAEKVCDWLRDCAAALLRQPTNEPTNQPTN